MFMPVWTQVHTSTMNKGSELPLVERGQAVQIVLLGKLKPCEENVSLLGPFFWPDCNLAQKISQTQNQDSQTQNQDSRIS